MSNRIETAVKEFGRLLVLAIPAILIQVITDDPVASTVIGGAILGVLKSWDRAIHEDPKDERDGLLPF